MGKHYEISYDIDIFPEEDAETPVEAARVAYRYMTAPDSIPPILEVRDVETGEVTMIDLDMDSEDDDE